METASPRITASMSVVIRWTPCAITAIPPITIQGVPSSDKARLSAASAVSIRDRSGSFATRSSLNECPAPPDILGCPFADLIARPGPLPHGFERRQRRQQLIHRTFGTWPFRSLQLTLHARRGRLTRQPALDGCLLVAHWIHPSMGQAPQRRRVIL